MSSEIKKYTSPQLEAFGSMSDLSAGGSGNGLENANANPSAPGQRMMQRP